MLAYAVRRIAGVVPTLLILLTLAFVLIRSAPGGPFDAEKQLPPQIEANLQAKYHLDEPLYQQYARYVWDVLHFDFGPSFQYKDLTVTQLITDAFPVSLKLGAASLLFALLFGVPLGVLAALRQNSPTDYGLMTLAMVGISIPNFVLAPLLILLLAVYNDWLPAGGLGGPSHFVIPVLALGTAMMAYVARLTRGSMIEVLRSDFIRTARAKGLTARRVLFVHALPAGLTPVVSFMGPATAGIITGSVVIETIFGIPGLGRFIVQGATNRDYTLVLGVVLFYGMLIILFNLLVDLVYAWLDPRVSY
ncbi:oligopeptide ABC transporter permease OppB [Spectribacter hydrogenoxidans]|uniref:Oligopeptide ABC transporter permease OppB n=1 Tax=Spectribacter hydrogenoxidans TaxID=3075608 RepID=A0ABU3BVZ0_9GAMM|nr:oligopeptide ABC transporter permease OppB [Salinisphaera sp. W335]MDT0633461.1 oligopeptide ABC transporter permease OppB [Salinisphaera sp. W335]